MTKDTHFSHTVWQERSEYAYCSACIDGLSNIASVTQERRKVDVEVESLGEALIQVPGSFDPRTGNNLPIVVCCILEQFVLHTMSAYISKV
jgi:hypothetical protein